MIGYLLRHPSCLLGPAIWLSDESGARFHRQLVANAWPTRPRWQWYLLLVANGFSWYLFQGWWSIVKSITTTTHDQNNWDLTTPRLFSRLVYLVFWIGAPAQDFFRFGLNRVEPYYWLDYVFSSEAVSWQRVFSCPEDSISANLLNDKYQFEQFLETEGLSATKTLFVVNGPEDIPNLETLKKDFPLFIKPRSANAMRGCMLLSEQDGKLVLQGKNLQGLWVNEHGESRIYGFISGMLANQPVLIQRLLFNDRDMQDYAGTEGLVTLRLITGVQGEEVLLAYAILEIPNSDQRSWDLQGVNGSGESVLLGPVPRFDAAMNAISKLHRKMPDVKTIAWDLCLTETGWTVLEGNTGWGLVTPQEICGTPLLRSGLQHCYIND